jgi:hypothetical protein
MKQVAHGVDEDHSGPVPEKRLGELLWYQTEVESLFVGVPRDAAEAFGERLCIAVGAT